ncbi:MAG: FAD:protein FMN transferase, partial [Proteobacteria bacterium]|nr:FAD:protein FMN transferase [Pseudomonadota bacterium]
MIKGARPTRRRFISLSAAAAGTALCPLGARAGSAAVRWRGRALGAPAEMILHHPDRAQAERLIRRVVVEIDRLEHIFSLYRPDSALATLNARGALADPPVELIELLEQSHTVWALSGGMFDPTVQPLWLLHARHFSTSDADPAG